MSWVRVAITPSAGASRERLAAAIFGAGAEGILEAGDALVTHVVDAEAAERVVAAARAVDSAAGAESAILDDVDWSLKWRDQIGVQQLGTLTVAPPWLAADREPGTTIVIEPAMAFGTGEHATTRGVIRLMQGIVRPGDSVADLGAGSAVLAIAAAKLGAARCFAIENDQDAIGNAEENVVRNGVGDRVIVLEGDAQLLLPVVGPVRVVFANIVSSVLQLLLPTIGESLRADGVAILSGILGEEREAMLVVLAADRWRVIAEDSEDVWWSVAVERAA